MPNRPTTKPPRQHKTPQQRAQEALDVSNRKVTRLTKALTDLRSDAAAVEKDLTAEQKRRDYLKTHPDLTTPTDK